MLRIVIIEDEPLAQNELKRLLQASEFEFNILDCLESIEEAVEWFQANEAPDLVFMDIQLADGLSFEIFTQTTIQSPVIFTTAFDEYALQAFKVNSIDYLLKPIEQTALNQAISKLMGWREKFSDQKPIISAKQLESLLELSQPHKEYKSRMIVKSGEQIKFITLSEVAYFNAEDNVVMLYTADKKRYIVDYSLDQLAEIINPNHFFRLNRGVFANKTAIGKIHRYFNSRLKIELTPELDSEVLVSRIKVAAFLEWMEK